MSAMEEARSEVVKLGELEFHFLDWGDRDAPPVLFLHGFAGHAWQTIFPAQSLAHDHWVIALDQRGHGDSAWADVYGSVPMVADAVAFLDWLGVGRTAVVGHSMGGINALCLSGLHPDLVSALALGDIGPEINRAGQDRIQSNVRQGDTFASVDEAYAQQIALNPTANPVALRSRVEHNLREQADGTLMWKYDSALRDGSARYENFSRDDQWAFWHALTVPTLLMRGALSDILTVETAVRMAESNPNARLVTLPGSGHSIATDVPDLVTTALADFLA
jgi:pimeloyl-ACP methyl ester carboxylesterase